MQGVKKDKRNRIHAWLKKHCYKEILINYEYTCLTVSNFFYHSIDQKEFRNKHILKILKRSYSLRYINCYGI